MVILLILQLHLQIHLEQQQQMLLSVNVVKNEAPTISFTNQTSNFNTNLANAGTTMVSMSVSDTEGDTPFSFR